MTQRRYLMHLFAWIAVYAVLLEGSLTLLSRGVSGYWVVPLTLFPMLPAFGILAAIMQRYRGLDELQQRIQSESILFAFGCTAILTFSYGFLQNTANAPSLSYFAVWPVMATCWIIGCVLANRRYK